MNTADLARQAVRSAARLRASLGIDPASPVCPFDVAEQCHVAVRFVSLPSLEGVYSPEPSPVILVNVERPSGRRRYTCGHELGHHVYGHGTRLDEFTSEAADSRTSEEFLANRFSAALLMPKLAVDSVFAKRGWRASTPTPGQLFVVAQELGVGFTTLVGYLERALGVLSRVDADVLRRTKLPRLRGELAGFAVERDLVVVDTHWSRETIDVEVGDVVLLPKHARFAGTSALSKDEPMRHLIGVAPGIGTLSIDSGRPSISVRVSRQEFTGLARYRHLEGGPDDE